MSAQIDREMDGKRKYSKEQKEVHRGGKDYEYSEGTMEGWTVGERNEKRES